MARMSSPPGGTERPLIVRVVYTLLGLTFLVVGLIGVGLPGLPGTPLLLIALWFFSMSNERLHRWMLTNRWFGTVLADYQAGLGIPRRFKAAAVASVIIAVTASIATGVTDWRLRVALVALAVAGIVFILTRPTRERVLSG